MGGEDGILAMALNQHFKCDGPSGWHFVAARRKTSAFGDGKCWQQVLREGRLQRLPPWFGTPLADLLARRDIVLSSGMRLPCPESFIVPRDERRQHQELSKTEQRKRKHELGDMMWEPKHLSDELWRRLKISAASLPAHLRPST